MSVPTPIFPAKRRVRRKRHQTSSASPPPPPPPPPPPLNVTDVGTDDPPEPGVCYWAFDGDATLNAPTVGNFRVLVDGEYLQASSASQTESYLIKTQYPTENSLDGCAYSIDEHPTGIVQAASIVLPQEGTIHAP